MRNVRRRIGGGGSAGLLVALMAVVALPATADENPYLEACTTFGGEYEERRLGCNPECEVTYFCRFPGGFTLICDEQGHCEAMAPGERDRSRPVGEHDLARQPTSRSAPQQDSARSDERVAVRGEAPVAAPGSDEDAGIEDEAACEGCSFCDRCLFDCRAECATSENPRRRRVCEAGCERECETECDG